MECRNTKRREGKKGEKLQCSNEISGSKQSKLSEARENACEEPSRNTSLSFASNWLRGWYEIFWTNHRGKGTKVKLI